MTDEEWDGLSPDERRAELVRRLRARGTRVEFVVAQLLSGGPGDVTFPPPFEPADYAGLR